MSEQKPIGTFVPFPVTSELAELMYKAYCAAYASSELTTRGTATEAAILLAGTPVQQLALKAAGWCHPQQLAGLRTDTDTPEKERFCVLSLVKIGSRDVPLVRQLEAQALLAARDAEIARLQTELAASKRERFNAGYLIACCNIYNMHNEESIAANILRELGITEEEVKDLDLCEYDAEALAVIRGAGNDDPIVKGGAA